MPNKRYQELQLSSQKKLETSAEQIRNLIPTSGEIGTLIEDMFRSYLVEVLPEKIGVSNGFVMDSEGGESQQMDIILYDKMTKLWTIFHRFSCDRFHTDAAPTERWYNGRNDFHTDAAPTGLQLLETDEMLFLRVRLA